MTTLSMAAILEKNRLCSDGAWAVLAKILLPSGITLRVCRNTADIAWPLRTPQAAAVTSESAGAMAGIPMTDHGYATGDTIQVSGTTNYNGTWTVHASSTANKIVISTPYVAETITGAAKVAWLWVAFPFDLDDLSEQSKNEVPRVVMKVGNASRAIMYYLEQGAGGVGAQVTLHVVNTNHLDETTAAVTVDMECNDCTADDQWAYFTLGAPSPFAVRFPRNRILKDFCRWRFKSTECGYAGGITTCDKSLANCRARANSARFGGFPGVGYGGVYVK